MSRVLIIEDEYNIRLLISKIIESLKLKVTAVESAEKGLHVLATEPAFSLVVTDINLPDMDGIALFETARVLYPHLRVLLVSAYSERLHEAQQKGAQFVLAKPFSRQQLVETVRGALR